jgi:SAM-dependent methyltransferase
MDMRQFHSLAEFDSFVADLNTGGLEREPERVNILANSYLVDPTITAVPSDPFSEAYVECVLSIHARLSGRATYHAETMERAPIDIAAQVSRPALYQLDGKSLGQYLESYGHIITKLEAKPGMRILELGCGDAQISLHLARFGCDVTVVDIEPNYIEAVKRQAEMLGVTIHAAVGDFSAGAGRGQFDRVFFYQSFHHSLRHNDLLKSLSNEILKEDGMVVFGPEPVIDPDGPWQHAVPYPWGPRLDGLSLRAMRTHGWMELGFQNAYFTEALRRAGFSEERFASPDNGLVFSIVARRAPPTMSREQVSAPEVVPTAPVSPPPGPSLHRVLSYATRKVKRIGRFALGRLGRAVHGVLG